MRCWRTWLVIRELILWSPFIQNLNGQSEKTSNGCVLNDNNTANFAGFLVARGNLDEAERQILEAWELCYNKPSQATAEVAFYRCIWLKMQSKADAVPLGYLKQLFVVGYERGEWWFDDVLRRLKKGISSRDFQFYTVLSKAILDTSKMEQLDTFDRWSKVKALPLAKII